MAHMLFKPEAVARSVLAGVRYQSTLARIINSDYSLEFAGQRGDVVNVKSPIMIDPARVYTKNMRGNEQAITYSELYQTSSAIKLTDQVYNAVKLPDDFTTFVLEDMQEQVLAPMAQSVAAHLNGLIAAQLETVQPGLTNLDKAGRGKFVGADGKTYDSLDALRQAGTDFVGKGAGLSSSRYSAKKLSASTNAEVLPAIRTAYQMLSERGLQSPNRYLVVGSGWEAALMSQDILNKANEAGTDGLLRDATIGRLYGFTVVTDYTIDPYKAYALDRDAVTLATRPSAIPRGVSFGQTVAQDGFSMRYIHDYDSTHLLDRAIVDLFAGAQILDGQRIVVLQGSEGFEEPAAPTDSAAASGPEA